jgi:hypothetical protein
MIREGGQAWKSTLGIMIPGMRKTNDQAGKSSSRAQVSAHRKVKTHAVSNELLNS